jgi:hypothetical protein
MSHDPGTAITNSRKAHHGLSDKQPLRKDEMKRSLSLNNKKKNVNRVFKNY